MKITLYKIISRIIKISFCLMCLSYSNAGFAQSDFINQSPSKWALPTYIDEDDLSSKNPLKKEMLLWTRSETYYEENVVDEFPKVKTELIRTNLEESDVSFNGSKNWNYYNYSDRNKNIITYNWLYNFDGQFIAMSMNINFFRGWQHMQDIYVNKDHVHEKYYKRFVNDDPFEVDGKVVAKVLKLLGAKYKLDNAKVALSFVQSLPHDPDIGNYQRYAIECLIDREGDCSDKSALFMAILAYMGYETIQLLYPGHLAVGVSHYGKNVSYYGRRYSYNGFYFYYADPNALGVGIGDEQNQSKYSSQEATLNKGYLKESSIDGRSYYTKCKICGGDGETHENRDFGPIHCRKCQGRGRL